MNQQKVNPALLAQLKPELDYLFDELDHDIYTAWVKNKHKDPRKADDLWAAKLASEELKSLIQAKIEKYEADALRADLHQIRGGQG